jgi:ectoine hydroxylase-related dioxygenase (phytanoyl-CoA dioxygenase family)
MDLEQLRRDGYTVVEGVAGPEQIEPLLALAQEASGVVLDDPSTWDPDQPELLELRGEAPQWALRQHPPLYEAFATLYGERDLAVSQDRLGVKVPGKRGMRIHHDVDPHDPPAAFAGLVYLTDTPAERGAFRCVPGIFREWDAWLERHPHAGVAVVDPEGHDVVAVPGRAGDLVVWDVRLPHANGENLADAPRVVQYVTMHPHGSWGDGREDHVERWRSNGQAELAPLGRRLVGLEPY